MNDPTMNPDLTTGSPSLSPATLGSGSSAGNGQDRIQRLAGSMHRAIDSIEQRFSSAGGGMSSNQARYGEKLRTRMNEQPLQSVGLVLAAGVLLDRLFLRRSKARVVKVSARPPSTSWRPSLQTETRSRRWSDAPSASFHRAGRAGQYAADKAGMGAALGLAGTRSAISNVARGAQALPLRMQEVTQRLAARSQDVGSMARSTLEAHPWAGVAAVLTASGLLTTALMRRRGPYGM